ncbi:hypothetical protein D3C71_221470 [compost metagenome]
MATTYPLTTLAATITATGITAPSFAEIFQSLQATFRSIYGTDAYIDPDSQDGQLLAAFAKAVSDGNDVAIAVYNSFSPSTSQYTALSNNVKINGIARQVPTRSSVVLEIGGDVGATITGGVAVDTLQQRWNLPVFVSIPPAGVVSVLATAAQEGAVEAEPGTVTGIGTPTLGWQTVTNPAAAAVGAPVETDAALRRRQTVSTALPSRTVLDGIVGAIANLAGVQEVRGYENDTDVTDANGLPEHSTAIVTVGGDPDAIALAYLNKKTPGAYTHGTTVVPVESSTGILYAIRYFIATNTRVLVKITIKARKGYTVAVGDAIRTSVAAYVSGLGIGGRVDQGRVYGPAQFYFGLDPVTNLYDPSLAALSRTFEVNEVLLAADPGPPVNADVDVAFNARAVCDPEDVELVVVP